MNDRTNRTNRTNRTDGKPRPFVVGEPWIVPMDRPCGDMLVVCTHEDGRARYLVIKRGRRWPHELNLARMGKAHRLEEYGVGVDLSAVAVVLRQGGESRATYSDGKTQGWQGYAEDILPLRGFEPDPKHWRMDAAVAPKFVRWVRSQLKNKEGAQ